MRLKDISTLSPRYIGEPLTEKVSFVPMEGLRNGKVSCQEIPFNEGYKKYTYFRNEDLLVAKVTPCFENGNIAIAKDLQNGIGFGSSEFFVLRCNSKVINSYLFYLSQTSDFMGRACSTMCGVGGLKRIAPIFMRTYELEVPSLEDQKRIVSFLDSKLSKIEKTVSLLSQKKDAYLRLRKSIIDKAVTRGLDENVKLKDSGIDWMGEIPENWFVYRLKDLGSLYSGLSGKSGEDFRCEDESLTKKYIPFTNILNNFSIDKNDFKRVLMGKDEKQNRVMANDILFLMSSEDYESIAKSALIKDDVEELYLNSFCKGFRIYKRNVLPDFVNYQLISSVFRDALRFEARGFTRINIRMDKISSMHVCLPDYKEQKAIVDYLDEKCAKIDAIVANVETQIEKYNQLRKSLIDEVITGKRKV